MSQSQNRGRFRTNPVEIVIFLFVGVIFINSVYNLLYARRGFNPTALASMTSNPITEGRAPASIQHSLTTLEVPCNSVLDKETVSNKIRLSGSLCDRDSSLSLGSQLIKAKIVNNQNQFA